MPHFGTEDDLVEQPESVKASRLRIEVERWIDDRGKGHRPALCSYRRKARLCTLRVCEPVDAFEVQRKPLNALLERIESKWRETIFY